MNPKMLFLALAFGLTASHSAFAVVRYADPIFSGVIAKKGIVYGKSRTYSGTLQSQALDLYQPKGDTAAARAAVVLVHGGGFVQGDKSNAQLVGLANDLALRGYVVVSINYRIKTNSKYLWNDPIMPLLAQDAEQDALGAIRWLRANAGLYKIDTANIAVGGTSAGAITSLMAAFDPTNGPLENSAAPTQSAQVAAAFSVSGMSYDLSKISAGDPPVYLAHGTADPTVPYQNAIAVYDACLVAGVYAEFTTIQAGTHGLQQQWSQIKLELISFLYRNMIQ